MRSDSLVNNYRRRVKLKPSCLRVTIHVTCSTVAHVTWLACMVWRELRSIGFPRTDLPESDSYAVTDSTH